ncbi:pilus assembly protein [Oceanobacillus piezotolerans]|uniref:Pilus assembly protein n=1 Tax=Oceanobacillus piezotolerans TaxID=2448030 RepID=A0A498DC19_9BACI|nr:pilus assembly protein [Oceanobacillus piezotolerans]RLL46507.1 pilus assembly protein [Oceanobacillus piezotolerans]
MKNKWLAFKNENGSLSIEFIGLLPFFFILFLAFWQIIGSGASLLLAQNAVNESAKVYSVTANVTEAENTLQSVIGSSTILSYEDFNITQDSEGNFTVSITGKHGIVFGPPSWRDVFEVTHQTYSRVIE